MGITPQIGSHSSRARLRSIDGRTSAGKYVRGIQRALIAECGGEGSVSAAQRLLIERTSIDLLRLRLMDHDLASGKISDHLAKVAHALRGTVRLSLRDLSALARPPKLTKPSRPTKAPKAAPAGPFDDVLRDMDRLLPSIDDEHRLAVELGRRGLDRVAGRRGPSGGRGP